MKLITELTQDVSYNVIEESNGTKSRFIEGVFAQSEIQNRNGRIYPKAVMESAFNKYITEKVKNSTAYGELGHPQGPKINEDRIAHLITDLRWSGNDVIGKAKILDTPMGRIAEGIMAGGGRIGVSTRGLGSVRPNRMGIQEVQNDFRLATAADIVTDPSAPAAFVNGIMENVEWVYDSARDNFIAQQALDETRKAGRNMNQKQLEEAALGIFERYLNILKEDYRR